MNPRTPSTDARPSRLCSRAGELVRLLGVILLATFGTVGAQAQAVEGDLVYKFTVVGVDHHAEAKPVQYVLLGNAFVHACDFIEECRCFSMASSVPLDYGTLNSLLQNAQRTLSGPVEVSDGTLLVPQSPQER